MNASDSSSHHHHPDKPGTNNPVQRFIHAEPYQWPYHGNLTKDNTVLLVIDMQIDFCGEGGYVDKMGYDLELMRAPIGNIQKVLQSFRKKVFPVMHTREGYRPDLADCPPARLWRTRQINAEIGSTGPCGRLLIRNEKGWDIIPELAPLSGETVIDKPSRSAFLHTDLHLILQSKGISNIILTGVTTDVCVHSTMRNADDLGYECLLLEDCCAATEPQHHAAAVSTIKTEGGVFGAVSDSCMFLEAFEYCSR
jgi:nicotinamidase-related amidase